MFDRQSEINNILTFGPQSIIRAMLESMPLYDLQRIRMRLDPHWSDGVKFDLDKYFTQRHCKLCGEVVLARKTHWAEQCSVVKTCRKQSGSIDEFKEALWKLLQ